MSSVMLTIGKDYPHTQRRTWPIVCIVLSKNRTLGRFFRNTDSTSLPFP
jgi:hypothetical protein